MYDLGRGRLAIKYIVFELLPAFVIGLGAFVFILVMFQSFKLSEYIIVHGAKLEMMVKLVFFMTFGYLPILFPIALLFAILMTYGRMSGDSEIVAMKALGLTPIHLLTPALILGVLTTFLSLQTAFRLAPWGHRELDKMIETLAQTRPASAIREGVFAEEFFNLVIYANKVDSKSGSLQQVFIYDERDPKSPLTIIANEGAIINSNTLAGQHAYLRLIKGNMHKSSDEFYTKINFDAYDINLFDPHNVTRGKTSPNAMDLSELKNAMVDTNLTVRERTQSTLEWHRRWSLSLTCMVFAFLGVSLGAVTNRRTARSSSVVISVAVIVVFWTLYVGCESVARAGYLPAAITAWITNACFTAFSIYEFRRVVES